MKSGNTIYEQNVDDQGKVHQIWHLNSIRVEKIPDASPIIGPDSGGSDIYSVDFQSADFAGLDWLSSDTYVGKISYQGHDALVFKKDLNPYPADQWNAYEVALKVAQSNNEIRRQKGLPLVPIQELKAAKVVPATAIIDLKTRLPLLVTIGGQKRFYQYAALNGSITLPADVAAAVVDYQKRLKMLGP